MGIITRTRNANEVEDELSTDMITRLVDMNEFGDKMGKWYHKTRGSEQRLK